MTSPQEPEPRTSKQHFARAERERARAAAFRAHVRPGYEGHQALMAKTHEDLAQRYEKRGEELAASEAVARAARAAAELRRNLSAAPSLIGPLFLAPSGNRSLPLTV